MPSNGIHFCITWANDSFLNTTSMGKSLFISQLQALGYTAQELDSNFVTFSFKIPVGKFIGQTVKIAFQISNSFPMEPPTGPHFSPLLLPITNGGGTHPYGGIHTSPLGSTWEYWSRPCNNWNQSDKSVKTYLAHIKNLLATIP